MSLLPDRFNRFIGRDLIHLDNQNSVAKRTLFKNQIATISVWLGQRDLVNQDLETFYQVSYMSRFQPYACFDIPDAGRIEDPESLRPVVEDLTPNLDLIDKPLAVFAIMTAEVAEKPWSSRFCDAILQYRRATRQLDDTAVYRIIMGGGFNRGFYGPHGARYHQYYELCDKGEEPRFWPEEEIAQELDASFLFYNSDAPTAGCMRLVDFMRRILGRDLPGVEFPCYSFEEITKIAWHVNRENYNALRKPGTIDKYQIGEDGRPIFPF